VLGAIHKSSYDTQSSTLEVKDYLAQFKAYDSAESYKVSAIYEPKQLPAAVAEEADEDESLTSSPLFFYGVPALAVAAIAATVGFLVYRKNQTNQ